MRVGHLNVTRPQYYDRQATLIALYSWQQLVGAHGPTIRWSYTVPTNRAAFVGSLVVAAWVRVPGPTAGVEVFSAVELNLPFDSNAIVRAGFFDVNVYASDRQVLGSGFVYSSGNILYGVDYQGAAGPFCDFLVTANISEYTA